MGLLAQFISFSTDFTIHKLSSLLYTSQVYFFKYGLKRFFSLVTNWKELTYNKRKWYSNMNPQSVKCLTHSQQLPHVSCGAGALIKGCFASVLVGKGRLYKALGLFLPVSYATCVCLWGLIGQKQLFMAATTWVLPGWYGCALAIWCSWIPACQPSAVFWIFLPWESLLNPFTFLQNLQYISYHLYCTPAKFTFSNTAWKVFFL